MEKIQHLGMHINLTTQRVHLGTPRLQAGWDGYDLNQIVLKSTKTYTTYVIHPGDNQNALDGEQLYEAFEHVRKWLEMENIEKIENLILTEPPPNPFHEKHVAARVTQALAGNIFLHDLRILPGFIGTDPDAFTLRSPETNIEYVVHLDFGERVSGEGRYLAKQEAHEWIMA